MFTRASDVTSVNDGSMVLSNNRGNSHFIVGKGPFDLLFNSILPKIGNIHNNMLGGGILPNRRRRRGGGNEYRGALRKVTFDTLDIGMDGKVEFTGNGMDGYELIDTMEKNSVLTTHVCKLVAQQISNIENGGRGRSGIMISGA
jgi:hypothetical protein